MTNKGIGINFEANIAPVTDGTADLKADLKGVSATLDEVSGDGKRSTEELEEAFRHLATVQGDEAERGAQKSSAAISRGTEESSRKVGSTARSIGNEAGNALSNFDGSVQSITSGLQNSFVNLMDNLPVVGAVLGAAGALGVGLIGTALNNATEDEKRLKAETAELAKQFIETGGVGSQWLENLDSKLKDLATDSAEGKDNLQKLSQISSEAGSSFEDLAQAYAGNTDGLKELWRANDRYLQSLYDARSAAEQNGTQTAEEEKGWARKIEAQNTYVDYLGQSIGVAKKAAKETELYAKAGGPELARKARLVNQINDAYDDAAGGVDKFIDKETGLFDTAKYLKAMRARTKALEDYQKTLAESDLSGEAKDFLSAQGEEAAAKFLAGYKAASPRQKRELNKIWTEAGKANSGEYVDALSDGVTGKKVKGPKIILDANAAISDFDKRLQAWVDQPHNLKVKVQLTDRNGKAVP